LLLRICSLLKSPLFHWSAGELLDAWPLQLFFLAEASRGLLPACISRGLQFLSEQMSSSLTKILVFWLLMCSRRGGLCADGSRVAFLFLKFWENPGRSIRSGTHPTCTMCLCALNDVYCTLVLYNLTNCLLNLQWSIAQICTIFTVRARSYEECQNSQKSPIFCLELQSI